MQHFIDFSVLFFVSAFCLRYSHEAVCLTPSGRLAVNLCPCMPSAKEQCLERLAKKQTTLTCGIRQLGRLSDTDLCCVLARLSDTPATPASSSAPCRCFLIIRMKTKRKRNKCPFLNSIKVRIAPRNIDGDVSDLAVQRERCYKRCDMEICMSSSVYRTQHFLNSTLNNKYRNIPKRLYYSTLPEIIKKSYMEIMNPQQNLDQPVDSVSVDKCQTCSCNMLKVSSQTQNIQNINAGLKQVHRRKRRSQRRDRSDSRENPSPEGSSVTRRNQQNDNGMTTHVVNHVMTSARPELLNETLFSLLRSLFPPVDFPESTAHWFIHHHVTTRQHPRIEQNVTHDNNSMVSTTHDFTWRNDNETSTSPENTDLSTVTTIATVTPDVTTDQITYNTMTRTSKTETITTANIFIDLTSEKYTTNNDITAPVTRTISTTPNIIARSITNKDDITSDTGENHFTIDVSATNLTAILTTNLKGWNAISTVEETSHSAILQSTTDARTTNAGTTDVVTAESTTVNTYDVTTHRILTATDVATPTNVTANDVTRSTTVAIVDVTTQASVTIIDVTKPTTGTTIASTAPTTSAVTTIASTAPTTSAVTTITFTTPTTSAVTTIDPTANTASAVTANASTAAPTTNADTTITSTSPTTSADTTITFTATSADTTITSTSPTTSAVTTITSTAPTTSADTTITSTAPTTSAVTTITSTAPITSDVTTIATTAPTTVTTMAETTDFTLITRDDAATGGTDNLVVTEADRRPTNFNKADVLSTESVTNHSINNKVTPDSRPYAVITDTTEQHTSTSNMAADDFTAKQELAFQNSSSTTKQVMEAENPSNIATVEAMTADTTVSNIVTVGAMTADTTVSNIATTDRLTAINIARNTGTMSTDITPNITKHTQDTVTSSTTQTISNQAMDTETPSDMSTRHMPPLHVLGFGATTSRMTTRDTTTITSTKQNATSSTTESVFSDISSTLINGSFQCSGTSGVLCFLEAANRSMQGETINNTRDQLMDVCEVLLDKIHTLTIVRSHLNSTKVFTNYFQVLDTFLAASYSSFGTSGLRQSQFQRVDRILTKVGTFMDNVMLSTTDSDLHKDIRLTLTNLDLLMFQSKLGALKGKQLNLRSVAVTVHDVHNFSRIDTSEDATSVVSALVLNVPGAEVSLVSSKSPTKAVVSSLVLALSAAVGRVKVSLIHSFSMTISAPKNLTFVPVCAFQSQNDSEAIWDTYGCQLSSYTHATSTVETLRSKDSTLNLTDENSTKRKAVCKCNHTTNFAILMQVVDFEIGQTDELVLGIITYVGCSVTLITQVIAITVFTCVRSLNSERVCVHRNLCIAIMAAQVTFISGIKAVQDKVVCAVVAVLLHYFYTSSFMWMLVEGLHLYNMIVKVFGTERSRILYYTCFGYGLPLLLVAISAAIDWEGYGTKYSCWLSIQRSTIWAFVGPAMAIIIVNVVILAVVIRIVVTSAKMDKNSDYDHIRAGIKAALLLLPLLGLTWIFGLAAVNEKLIVFQYLFAILNTLQGFFIFMLHCVFNTEVRQALNRMREQRSLQKGDFGNTCLNDRSSSSSDSRSFSSTYVTIRETLSSAFSRRTIQVSPADFSFSTNENQHEIARRKMAHKGKELTSIGN